MLTITHDHIISDTDIGLENDQYAEGQFVARIGGRELRVTFYAHRDGPLDAYDIDDAETGDFVSSSRFWLADRSEPVAVDGWLISQLSRELHGHMFNDAE